MIDVWSFFSIEGEAEIQAKKLVSQFQTENPSAMKLVSLFIFYYSGVAFSVSSSTKKS
jgi:hypothetical protein